jgi:hypothetical protein
MDAAGHQGMMVALARRADMKINMIPWKTKNLAKDRMILLKHTMSMPEISIHSSGLQSRKEMNVLEGQENSSTRSQIPPQTDSHGSPNATVLIMLCFLRQRPLNAVSKEYMEVTTPGVFLQRGTCSCVVGSYHRSYN